MPVASLSDDIAAYAEMRQELELDHMGKWVVIFDRELVGTFDEFQNAAKVAIGRFGRGPYHIRKVGPETISMPMSMLNGGRT